jgi:hypothetical protein
VRLLMLGAAVLLIACAPAPEPAPRPEPKPDPTAESWYDPAVEQLTAIDREAEGLLKRGKSDEAAAMITRGQAILDRLLAVPRPTLAAMEAASDLDDLYGRMLMNNRHYGWARLVFQKNLTRWKSWKPQTPETARRMQVATSAMAECDRHLSE